MPVEQRSLQLLLQLLDSCRYIGLHIVQALGCLRDTSFFGNRQKYFEKTRIHAVSLPRITHQPQ